MADPESPVFAFTVTAVSSTSFDGFRMVGSPTADRTQVLFDGPVLGTPGAMIWWDVTAPLGVDLYYEFISNLGSTTGILGPIVFDAGRTWLTDPVRPWADIGMDTCPPGDGNHRPECVTPDPVFVWGGFTNSLTMPVDAGLFDVLNAEHPADVFARRKYADGSFRFFTRTLEAIDLVYDLFTAGGPLMLRTPAIYGWHDQFIQPGTPAMTFVTADQRHPIRQWDVPFTVVDRPIGPIQGTDCNNWCEVEEAFTTFADLTAYPGTWGDLMQGEVLCPVTPPELDGFGMGGFGDGPFGDGG
jgi:hypothetical protein